MQQVRVIMTTADKIENEIAQKLLEGWRLLGPVQYGGQVRRSVGQVTSVDTVCIATLVKEIS